MKRKPSGEDIKGLVVALLAIACPLSFCFAAEGVSVSLKIEKPAVELDDSRVICLPVPEGAEIEAEFSSGGRLMDMDLVETAHIRDQRIAIFRAEHEIPLSDDIEIALKFRGATGPACVDAGPLSRTCEDLLTGYGRVSLHLPPPGLGTVTHCQSINDCRNAKADILLITGRAVSSSDYVDSLALHWSETMGLNVAVINIMHISTYSPVMIRDFIRDLYNSVTAEHFGDGHLGFVVLLGDAFEDDNVTRMIPDYDGYGGDCEASDHFYACVKGDDEFEDVMIGRIPVGNEQELENYYHKLISYSPLPPESWARSLLFAGGCFFAIKEDYVNLFDSLEVYLPDGIHASRYYRYDFPQTDQGDAQAIAAMVDSLNAGKLFVMYCGHADRWNWGGRFERVFGSAFISDLDNSYTLPIVLSIACYSGWFDNVDATFADGGVDCFAERLLTDPGGGAIACLASTRDTGGDASTEFTSEIIRSAYVNGSTYLGELILETKVKHLSRLGNIEYVRQFNLFGDPCLNFVLNDYPSAMPDLVLRPYHVEIKPEFLKDGEPLTVSAEVWNAAGVGVSQFDVAIYDGDPAAGGEMLDVKTLTDFWGWEKRRVTFQLPGAESGDLEVFIAVDPAEAVAECDEANNSISMTAYVYPCQAGFPVKVSEYVEGQVIGDLDSDGDLDILVTSGGTQAQALSYHGGSLWLRDDLGLEEWFDNIEPAAFDLNGDGATEVVVTTRSAVYVLEGATGSTIWKRYTDHASVSPVITDLEHDGSFEILLPTYDFSSSNLYAFNAQGSYRWIYHLPTSFGLTTGMVCCDFDLDGYLDIVMSGGGTSGNLRRFKCSDDPGEQPHAIWSITPTGEGIAAVVGADLDRDGDLEVVAAGGMDVFIVDALTGAVQNTIELPSKPSALSIADTDGDKILEILCVSESGYLYIISGTEIVLEVPLSGTPVGAPIAADLDGDGISEIMCSLAEGVIRIMTPSGSDVISPVPVRDMCYSTPVASDIDFDGRVEIFAGSSDSLLFALDLGVESGRSEWPCAGASELRAGVYAQPFAGMFTDDFALYGRVDIIGDIVIDEGSRLTIERGTEIRLLSEDVFAGGSSSELCEIVVKGELISRGNAVFPVSMSGMANPPEAGSWMGVVIDHGGNANITHTEIAGAITGLDCRSSDVYLGESRISDCIIGVKSNGTSPLIDSNTLCKNVYGISAGRGSAVIVGNTISGNCDAGIIMADSCRAALEDNLIENTTNGNGLSCYSSCPSILGGNRFENNSMSGIYLSSSSPAIDSCWVGYNSDCGIKIAFASTPVISKTSIVQNGVGVLVFNNAAPILGNAAAGLGGMNDIRGNAAYALKNYTQNLIMAQSNWWGAEAPEPSMFLGLVDYSLWLTQAPAGVEDGRRESDLLSLYPNPFTHELNLSFSISRRDVPLEVSIYDVRGKLVKRLLSSSEPGPSALRWDGTDSAGRKVASGTYLVLVRSPYEQETRKVIVLR
jgi:hypothetical protein